MQKTCYLLIGLVILFSGVAQAGDIVVEPTEYNVDLIGGDTISRPITITWTGETAVVGFIETGVTPDGEGLDITYSEDPVILFPGVPNTISMTIDTAINLVPGDYVITTLVFTEIEKIIEYRSSGCGGGSGGTTYIYETIEIENITHINMLLDIIQQLNNKLNATNENNSEQIALLTSVIDTLNDAIVFLEDQLQQEPEKEDEYPLIFASLIMIIIIGAIIFIIMVAYFYHKFRVLELQRIKEMKENKEEVEK